MNRVEIARGILILGLAGAMGRMSVGAEYYVTTNGDDAASGTTWETSRKTIQAAVDLAADGDTVWVGDGTYALTGPVTVTNGLTVRGLNGRDKVTLDGRGATRCLVLAHPNAVVQGVSLVNGLLWFPPGVDLGGAGALIHAGSLTHCRIACCGFFRGEYRYGYGGGVCLLSGTVQHCIIVSNVVSSGLADFLSCGGGIYNRGGIVRDCLIRANRAQYGGGADNRALMQRCDVSFNISEEGGHPFDASDNAGGVNNCGILDNCVVYGNTACHGWCAGGIANFGDVYNCTVVGNYATPSYGDGDVFDAAGGIVNWGCVVNTIVVHNEITESFVDSPRFRDNWVSMGATYRYCCSMPLMDGEGNIAGSPQFMDPGAGCGESHAAGNYRLFCASPCINAGTNMDWMAGASDLDGQARIRRGRVDMGAYESAWVPAEGWISVSASDGDYGNKIQVAWPDVPGAAGYTLFRSTNTAFFPCTVFPVRAASYADTDVEPGRYYYYSVAAVDAQGACLAKSPPDRGYRCAFNPDLSDAAAVFIDEHANLYKVDAAGVVAALCPPHYRASHILRSPQGYVFIGFTSPVRINNDGNYILARIDPDDNRLTGIDTNLSSIVWGALSPGLQLDRDENIYYLANQRDGKIALKRWVNESNVVSMINDHIGIHHWLAQPNGTILMSGTTRATGVRWLRGLTRGLDLYNVATDVDASFMVRFPDNRVHLGLSGSGFTGVYRLPGDLASLSPDRDFYAPVGPGIGGYEQTADGKVFVIAGTGVSARLVQLYPSIQPIDLAAIDTVSLMESCGEYLLVAGLKNNVNQLVGFDPATRQEVRLLDDNIEIYHLCALSDQGIWFDGLRFSGNRYIIGKIDLLNPPAAVGGPPAPKGGYREVAALSGKPIDLVAVGAAAQDGVTYVLSGDFDGDGKADMGRYHQASGGWSFFSPGAGYAAWAVADRFLGGAGFAPAVGDYDGDGRCDPCVYDASTGEWRVKLSAAGYGLLALPNFLGGVTEQPATGDYDGDGKADPAVFDWTTGEWTALLSGAGYAGVTMPSGKAGAQFTAVPADYDGDRKADPAVYDNRGGTWTAWLSGRGYEAVLLDGFGGADYIALPNDYDGDGFADLMLYHDETGAWIARLSSQGFAQVRY